MYPFVDAQLQLRHVLSRSEYISTLAGLEECNSMATDTVVVPGLGKRLFCTKVIESASVIGQEILARSLYDITVKGVAVGHMSEINLAALHNQLTFLRTRMAVDRYPDNDVLFASTELKHATEDSTDVLTPCSDYTRVGYLINNTDCNLWVHPTWSATVTETNRKSTSLFIDLSLTKLEASGLDLKDARLYLCRRTEVDWAKIDKHFKRGEVFVEDVIHQDGVMQFVPPTHRCNGWAGERLTFMTVSGMEYGNNEWKDRAGEQWIGLDKLLSNDGNPVKNGSEKDCSTNVKGQARSRRKRPRLSARNNCVASGFWSACDEDED